MKFPFLFFLILITGCTYSKPLVVYRTVEKDICENETITIVNETIKYINVTSSCNCTNVTSIIINQTCNSTYVLGLIRQIKHLEKEQDKYYNSNVSECAEKLDNCSRELDNITKKLKEILE